MFVFYGKVPFRRNGCYGVKYGQLSSVRQFPLFIKTKNQNSNGIPFEDLTPHSSLVDSNSKGTKSNRFVVFGGGKAYGGTPNRRKQSISYFESTAFLSFQKKFIRGTFCILFVVRQTGCFFAPLAKINYDLYLVLFVANAIFLC